MPTPQATSGWRAAALLMIVMMSLSAPSAGPRTARADGAEPRIRPSEIIVSIERASGLTVDALSAELGATPLAQLTPGSSTYLLGIPAGVDPELLAERLELDPRLDFAEPNYVTDAPEANPRGIGGWGGTDPSPLPGQPALAQIRLTEAHALSRGAGMIVAVIDTGAQLDHPGLVGSLLPGYDFIDGDMTPEDVVDGVDNDLDGLADEAYGHGTHVAGIVHTVAPDAQILVIRALTAEGSGESFTVAQAISYAVGRGATTINLSLGTSATSSVLRKAVIDAANAGVVVVAAAGNEATTDKQYPAAGNCAIAVTSVGAEDRRSAFANVGGWVSVAAPGESIFSAFPTSGYAYWSGTSMATPFVAGQAALLRSLRPALTVREVGDLIGGTAVSIGARNLDLSGQLGDGRIDLAASLSAARAGAPLQAEHSHIGGSCITPDLGG
jgi:thermitase